MSIPTAHDARLGAISDAASSVQVTLTTMRRAHPRDIDRMRQTLRERLQDYCDLVVDLANEGAQ
jgi:hypothetical protein